MYKKVSKAETFISFISQIWSIPTVVTTAILPIASYFSPILDLLGWPLTISLGGILGVILGLFIKILLQKVSIPKDIVVPETFIEISFIKQENTRARIEFGSKKNIKWFQISDIMYDSSKNPILLISLSLKKPILEDAGTTLAVDPIGTSHKGSVKLWSFYKELGLLKSLIIQFDGIGFGKYKIYVKENES